MAFAFGTFLRKFDICPNPSRHEERVSLRELVDGGRIPETDNLAA